MKSYPLNNNYLNIRKKELIIMGRIIKDSEKNDVEHPYSEKTDKSILKKNPWMDYGLHLTVLFSVIVANFIGPLEITISKGIEIVFMPLLYTMVLSLIFYLAKPIKWIGRKQARVAEGAMMFFVGILIAKLAISSGNSINMIFEMGPALLLQELGHLATILIALPVALLLGFKREAIGMTSSIGREPEVAVIVDKYGFDSAETRGIFALFIVGTIIGTVFISFLTSLSVSIIPLHPFAFAMACGVGSASMNAASLGPTLAAFPGLENSIEAFAGFSNLLSFCVGVYIVIFIAVPLTEKLYDWLEPKIGKNTLVKQEDE